MAKRSLAPLLFGAWMTLITGTMGLVAYVEHPIGNQAQEHTDQAEVVAKVWQPGGALLCKGYFQIDDNKVWQPLEDAPGASRQLILQVGGQPVSIAVSSQVYESHCRHANPMLGSQVGKMIPRQLGGCGAVHEAGRPAPEPILLDTLQVSYTQDKDGAVKITSIDGMEVLSTGWVERYRLRKMFENQKEVSEANYYQRQAGPTRG